MATKLLSLKHKVGGVLTDVTSAVLADPTSAFGVRLVSDGSLIVASGTALTHDGTGLYSYSVTGLTAGAAYEAYYTYVYGGETKRVQRFFTAAIDGAMTLTTARSIVRQFARNADSSTEYTDTNVDTAIQTVCDDFILATRVTKATDTVALASGTATASTSAIADFRPERLIRTYIAGKNDLETTEFWRVDGLIVTPGEPGTPALIGFKDASNFAVYPVPDANYTLSVLWLPPLTTFTPGTASPDAVSLNIPADYLRTILAYGATALLQHNEPQHAYASESWKKYTDFRDRLRGIGSLGARSAPRGRLR